MSIQQGLISPPLSGRTDKADQPRIQDAHKLVNAVDVFSRTASAPQAQAPYYAHHHHVQHDIRSPVKKHHDNLSDAERASRPLTPPMSKDVRHDQEMDDGNNCAMRHRIDSEGDLFDSSVSSVPAAVQQVHAEAMAGQPFYPQPPMPTAGLMPPAPIHDRFHTLNQGISFESDDEHNPFLDRRPSAAFPAASRSHHSQPYYDEFDSDQDAEGSVHEDDMDRDFGSETTPRASSSQATTPPPRRAQGGTLRPARPFSERVSVVNEPVVSTMPIRDTPKNPFLAGGPADNGFHGPNGHVAYRRAKHIPGKERGKIAYVFRGQRVTYADPEYDSEEDDSEEDQRARSNEFNPYHNAERPPRLQPRLLFPPTASISSSQATQRDTRRGASLQARNGQSSSSSSARSNSHDGRDTHAPRAGGGLFAAQIAAQKQQHMTAPSSSARLQSITRDSYTTAAGFDGRQAARDALLARLDHTDWSDDDEDQDADERHHRHSRARGDSVATVVEEEHHVERHALSRSQSQCKRLSDELQRGHAEEADALGRPMKRSRASYAY